MKKLIAILSAVTIMLSTTSMVASAISFPSLGLSSSDTRAEDIYKRKSYYVAGSGCCLSAIDICYETAFMVITDGTAPSEESLQAIPDFVSCEKLTVKDGIIQGENIFYNNFDANLPEGMELYKINVSGYDNLVKSARQYLLENDNVEVFFPQFIEHNDGSWLDHNTTMGLIIRNGCTLPEKGIEGLSIIKYCRENDNGMSVYEVELDDANKARLDGSDNDLKVLVEVANNVMGQYEDVVRDVSISALYPLSEDIGGFQPSSVWLDLGDTDGNTVVNVSDAAIVLQEAAQAGAGNAKAEQNLDVMDVNLDGTVNASDAACILMYAAQYGADGAADWQDILR